MSKYNSISIKEAMESIATNGYLLPAIQRKFVWDTNQIEMLFDSIMKGYPINSFMLWKVTDKNIRENYKFYQFICNYTEKFGENNTEASTKLIDKDFYAVIDGQQRLNSLYIGLNGTYRYKKPNKHWTCDEKNMPTRRLYLDLSKPLQTLIDNEKVYNFVFKSREELENDNSDSHWFEVSKIISLHDLGGVNQYLNEHSLSNNVFAVQTLSNLLNKIFNEEIINYYVIAEQNLDKVLEVFLRTNRGGTSLSFSDLLMSIASANWQKFDARDEIKSIRDEIFNYGNPKFDVTQDFILKSILVLSDSDVRFKLDNFGRDNVISFESQWADIRESLVATFKLFEQIGYNDSSLRAKNAAIPVAYYIKKNQLADSITKTTYDIEEKKKISKWLTMSLLKGIFGGHSDGTLVKMREVIKNTSTSKFPMQELYDAFKNDMDRNYYFDEESIQNLLYAQYRSNQAEFVLMLLYPDVVVNHGKSIAEDHMHPKTIFEDQEKRIKFGLPDDKDKFPNGYFTDVRFYNSVLNLQLLEENENKSKGDDDLSKWASEKNKKASDLFIEDGTSLDILQFGPFIESRKKQLTSKLKNILKV